MNSTVKVFGYKNGLGGTSVKRIFVMNETADRLQGFNLEKLTKSEQKALRKALADHKVGNTFATKGKGAPEKNRVEDPNYKNWMRAWRSFKVAEITDLTNAADPATKAQIVDYIASQGLGKSARAIRQSVNAVLRGNGRKSAYGYKITAVEGGYKVSR